MLVAAADYLPQYKTAIEQAKKNLATNYVTPDGAQSESTRRKVKSVDEIRLDAAEQKVYFKSAHHN